MKKSNHFSERFASKTTEELRTIVEDKSFQKDAKVAAVWELEGRGEATEEELQVSGRIEVEYERRRASELSGQRYRTFWQRFFAAFIDGLAMWPIAYLLSYISNSSIGTIAVIGNLLYNMAPYVYSVVLHGNYGQTLGKMAMGVKVVDVETEDAIDLKQAFIRDSVPISLMILIYAYSIIIFYGNDGYELQVDFATLAPMLIIGILGFIWTFLEIFSMLFNNKFRALHDLLARTVVVRTN